MPKPKSLQLLEFSDKDLLYALEECYEDYGGTEAATSREVARKIGVEHEHPAQCVGSRMARLRQIGATDLKETKDGDVVWFLTDIGDALLHPRDLSKTAQKSLANLDEGQRIALTNRIAREVRGQSRTATHLASRAWRHQMGNWRDPKLSRRRK